MRRTVSLVFVVPWGARVSSTESLLALMFAVPFISSITFHSPASSQHHLYKRLRHGIAHIINLHISAFSQCRSYHYGFFDLSACTSISYHSTRWMGHDGHGCCSSGWIFRFQPSIQFGLFASDWASVFIPSWLCEAHCTNLHRQFNMIRFFMT
jgi:hypothetical protein